MSYFSCPDTGSSNKFFSPSHVEEIAAMAGMQITTKIPITAQIAVHCVQGT